MKACQLAALSCLDDFEELLLKGSFESVSLYLSFEDICSHLIIIIVGPYTQFEVYLCLVQIST